MVLIQICNYTSYQFRYLAIRGPRKELENDWIIWKEFHSCKRYKVKIVFLFRVPMLCKRYYFDSSIREYHDRIIAKEYILSSFDGQVNNTHIHGFGWCFKFVSSRCITCKYMRREINVSIAKRNKTIFLSAMLPGLLRVIPWKIVIRYFS